MTPDELRESGLRFIMGGKYKAPREQVDTIAAQGNRIAEKRSGRFLPTEKVLAILRELDPQGARKADAMLDAIAKQANWRGWTVASFRELREAIADALDEVARTAAAIARHAVRLAAAGRLMDALSKECLDEMDREELRAEGVAG